MHITDRIQKAERKAGLCELCGCEAQGTLMLWDKCHYNFGRNLHMEIIDDKPDKCLDKIMFNGYIQRKKGEQQ